MKKSLTLLLILTTVFIGCKKDNENVDAKLNLNILGLEDLGNSAMYEGWIMVDGSPMTTGTFTVDGSGNLNETSFTVNSDDLASATAFILTIEPYPDPSPNPSETHIIAGDFSGSSATLSVGHGAALGDDFSMSMGKYILATPTNGANTDEKSGIWFLDLSGGAPEVGLDLPVLQAGWKYEGWTVIDGTPVTTGTFLQPNVADDSDPHSGTMARPPFPGEDYLNNAPIGLTFPTDLSGGTAVISIEPDPDNSPNPFTLKPLAQMIPSNAVDHVTYDLGQNLGSFPTGTATR